MASDRSRVLRHSEGTSASALLSQCRPFHFDEPGGSSGGSDRSGSRRDFAAVTLVAERRADEGHTCLSATADKRGQFESSACCRAQTPKVDVRQAALQ